VALTRSAGCPIRWEEPLTIPTKLLVGTQVLEQLTHVGVMGHRNEPFQLRRHEAIADEMQNATDSQMKMLLTRLGENSKMVVTGDLEQHDRGYHDNGLKMFVDRLVQYQSDMIGVVEFTSEEVARHPVVSEVLDIYANY